MILGNYRTIREIDRGGMGTVYQAEHIVLGKPVAIKLLHERKARDAEACQRFLMEARTASQLRHPHIVEVTDYGQDEAGRIYFVMELLEGESLQDMLARNGALPLLRTLTILHQIAQALDAAHARGIIHRDVKPDNVFVERRLDQGEVARLVVGGDGQLRYSFSSGELVDFVKLLDFGIAKFRYLPDDPEIAYGTPAYMAPEQIHGAPVDARTDVYGLGLLFFEMLTGEPPFSGSTVEEIARRHLRDPPPLLRTVRPDLRIPETVEAVILRALSKTPAYRQQSAQEFDNGLHTCLGTLSVGALSR